MSAWPRTMFGRVALVVGSGLLVAHLLSFWIILRERGELGRSMMLGYLGRDVATALAVLDRVPAGERAAWLDRLARPNYRYRLAAPDAAAPPAEEPAAQALAQRLAVELGGGRVGTMRSGGDAAAPWQLPLQLADGTPLTLQLLPPAGGVSRTSLALLALQLLVLGTAAALGVRLAVRPLATLSEAAAALVPGPARRRLQESGPREVVQAAQAFNALQGRIDEHLAERLRLLAAISHDLQTPVTRMRLRAEQVADSALREKLLADLQGMQSLVEQGLAYARTAEAAQESPCPIDLDALLDGLVCDAVDAGHSVTLAGHLGQPLTTRLQALRRVLGNLLDNALKFAGAAQVELACDGSQVTVRVCDRGPGIPPAQLEAVLQPYVRVETSRSPDTGGSGLGLAIAHQLAGALGGRLRLVNREGGGLEARLSLPLRWPT